MKNAKSTILEYLEIFWSMFLIGLTTFGGGYAMMAIIENELGEKKHWLDKGELLDYIAIAQITPGIIAVNVSTFVGRKRKGIFGAVMATLGVITPSIIIIMIIAAVLVNFADNEYVKHAFAGIRVCVCALILKATIKFFRETVVDILTLIVFLAVFIVAAFSSIDTVLIVIAMIIVSVILTVVTGGKLEEKEKKKKAEGGDGE